MNILQNAENVPRGVQMNNFLLLHPSGLLYRFLHKIPIFETKSIKLHFLDEAYFQAFPKVKMLLH